MIRRTIAKVAQIGYKEVEFAGYFGRTGSKSRRGRQERLRSFHSCSIRRARRKVSSVIETSKTIGMKYIVCPWIPEELRKSRTSGAGRREVNHAASSKKAGSSSPIIITVRVSSVNGSFPTMNSQRVRANLVKMEMDLCWITVAGADPSILRPLSGRFPLVMLRYEEVPRFSGRFPGFWRSLTDMTAVGSGIIDWKKIFAQSDKADQAFHRSTTARNPFESITKSYEYPEQAALVS